MKIKKAPNNKIVSNLVYLIFSLAFIFLLVKAKDYSTISGDTSNGKKSDDIENATTVASRKTYKEIIKNRVNLIHSDEVLSIYLNNISLTPNLIYVYANSLEGRRRSDSFFSHVYLKDRSDLVPESENLKFLNLDFKSRPDSLWIGGKKYYIFKRALTHRSYKGGIIDVNKILRIETGRFHSKEGRSYGIVLNKFEAISPVEVSNELDGIVLSISDKNFNKIRSKRKKALGSGILITDETDLVNAKVSINSADRFKAEVRLKGDWTDHLEHPVKWSFRVILDGENTLNGMRKFSLQHPKVRNYHWEWLFNKVIKANDLIGLRYDFVNLDIAIDHKDSIQKVPAGIMAIEESFDKILIENNRRREGIILSFNEFLVWNDREKQSNLNLATDAVSWKLHSLSSAPIKVYNENKVLSDPVLSKQFDMAKDLLDGVRTKKLKISDAFDIDKLTMFVALSNLFGGTHGLVWHNLRIYFNPITNKLEPVSFDSNCGHKLGKIHHYPFSSGDSIYTEKLLQKMTLVANSSFIDKTIAPFSMKLHDLSMNLMEEFNEGLDISILDYNCNFIKKKINPSDIIVSGLLEYDENEMKIDVTNLTEFPIEILGLEHKDGKVLNKNISGNIIYPGKREVVDFRLKDSFVNAFVSKKNKKGEFRYPNDIKKLRVTHAVLGVGHKRKGMLIPFTRNQRLSEKISEYQRLFKSNITQFDFISIDFEEMKIKFNSGSYRLDKNLVIPSGFNVIVENDFNLDLVSNASIISHSPIQCKGTRSSPIRFYSSNGSGAGIFITSSKEKSTLDHCYFTNLSNPTTDIWHLSGSVNFHETNVEINNSVFENNRSEDALNIIRSEFTIMSTSFKNTQSDAFDGDFVVGKIQKCRFLNTGNDGIDISGSDIFIRDIVIDSPADKAISAGESSSISGKNIKVSGGEIGIVSKDLSKIALSEVVVENTRLGLSSFQKKTEYGTGVIEISNLKLLNNELDYLIENGSQLLIDNVPVKTVSDNVIDQMYGKEYGKSSK